jgi:2-phosphosulfolactate phosphatase
MPQFRFFPLQNAHQAKGVVVVIDVLRAFTTAAFAFDAQAEKIHPVASLEEALMLRNQIAGSLVMGEVGGDKPEGFDLGNSPAEVYASDIAGKIIIQRTSAGTQGLVRAVHAHYLLAASFVVATATAALIRDLNPDLVSFIVTGQSLGRDGDEDRACGEFIQILVEGGRPDPQPFIERAKQSTAGKSFMSDKNAINLSTDLAMSIQVDRFSFSLPVYRDGDLLAMYRKNL